MTTKELYKIEIMKELGLLPEDSLKNVKLSLDKAYEIPYFYS